MKIRLEVLASTSIKRKKPWRQIVWLGKERESLFLLDEKRVSVLYVPSGKTKRNVPKISSLLLETVYLTSTPGGLHLVGVQSSGEIFVWQKDQDDLKTICGLASLLQSAEITLADGCQAFPSSDCSLVILVLGNRHVFLWQKSVHGSDHKNNTLLGKWARILPPNTIQLPSSDCKEASMHAVYSNSEVFGVCAQLSIVSNQRGMMNVVSLLIRFGPKTVPGPSSDNSVTPTWTCLQNPLKNIQTDCEAICLRGAYLCKYTHDGQILATGVNQKSPTQTSILFISPLTETVLVSDMRGCGLRDAGNKRGRQYWISDMTWTSDNLFLGIILHNGSAGLLSRLGEPLVILSKGCSVEMGPAYYLPFTPLISVQSDKSVHEGLDLNPSANSELDPLHQRFSVTSHPSLPILLFSDGYIVTITQLPSELSPMIFMRDLVLESSSHLREIAETHRLDLTLANAYNLPAGELESMKHSPRGAKHGRHGKKSNFHYSFEDPSVSLNETLDSEVSFALGADDSAKARAGAVQNMSSGKIVFGEPDVLLATEGSFLNEPNSTMKAVQLARVNLFNVWKLAASTTELWSANMDKILNHTVHNIIKLFSLVLDSPQIKDLLDEAVGSLVNSPAVHTASLFKVISMYKQLLDLLHFDCQQRHLLASVLQLSHKTLLAILSSVGLCQSDPRLKTLTGCFTLLKFTEKSIQQTYVSMPKAIHSKGLTPRIAMGEGENQVFIEGGEGLHSDAQLAKRLTATWKLLYKSVGQFLSSNEVNAADVRQAQALQTAIQQCLLEVDAEVPRLETSAINTGERLSLDGKHTLAMNAWREQLRKYQEVGNVKNAARLFHSLLYTYILRNDLATAVSFVDSLIVKSNPDLTDEFNPEQGSTGHNLQPSLMTFVTSTLRAQAFHEPDMVPCIRDRAIRQVVQTMARFMAAYFSNQTIFIFPPHNPTPLPAVHFETSIANSRIIPKYPEDMTAIIRHQKLGSVWTVERTLEYLLLSGLVCEAAWFADRMGDWKATYQLSVAHILHRQLAASLYSGNKKPLILPEWLAPDAIMKRRLERIMRDDLELTGCSSDMSHLTKILEDISLAGVMGFVEVGPWLLEQLVSKLKNVVKQLTPLVTKDFYLPAPPLYCPQPPRTDRRQSLEAEDEIKLRQRASSIIQLTLCVMNATHLSIPAVRWYIHALEEVQKKAAQFKANTEGPCLDLPDILYQYLEEESEFDQALAGDTDHNKGSIISILSSFRDLCSILWLLHARDKLSVSLRSREKALNLGLDVEDSEQWVRECFFTLQWAVHLVPFSRFLSDEASIYKVVLSLLLDLPATEEAANILAEHMYDLENLHPEVQERLDRMLNTWQGIILVPEADGKSVGDSLDMDEDGRKSVTFLGASPRGKSLSVYFHKQCMLMDKNLKKKKNCYGSYEEFIFTDTKQRTKKKLNIGSRPFETKKSFMHFMDTFVSVSFSRVLEVMADQDKIASLPFLRVFAKHIVDKEMEFFIQRVAISARKKNQGLAVLSGASSQALARAASQENVIPARSKIRNRSVPGRTSGRDRLRSMEEQTARSKSSHPVGLFRGKSMIEQQLERGHACVRRYESEPGLDDLDLDDFEGSEAGPSSRAGGSRQNLTEPASRYSQTEENISRSTAARDQGRSAWSLTVNFGKKYTTLQQLIEWLEVWGNKSHALGVPDKEEILDISAKMKIQIPAQLIILSLWLLENKYNKHTKEEPREQRKGRSRRAQRLSHSPPVRSQSLSPSPRSSGRGSVTPPRQTHESLISKHSAARQSQMPSLPDGQLRRSTRHVSPADRSGSPKDQIGRQHLQASGIQEQNEIIDAYTQVLDGPEDSSSIDVSSLASDELDGELKNTLNVIRGTGTTSPQKENSALNHTMYPKDESPERQPQAALKPKDSSTPVKPATMPNPRTPSVSPPPPSQHSQQRSVSVSKSKSQAQLKSASKEPASPVRHPDLGSGIAGQLQGIIRDELRRIMEVQHRSVLAMMGALDGLPPSEMPPLTVAPVQREISQRQTQTSLSQNDSQALRVKRQNQKSASPVRRVGTWPNPKDEDESLAEMQSFQEEIVAHSSARTHVQRPGDRRDGQMREALSELKNLQREASRPRLPSVPQHSSYSEDISARASRVFSSYPGPHEGGNFRLPLLHLQAWSDHSSQPPSLHGPGVPKMPLLHIDQTSEPEDPFRNLRRYLPQMPPPQSYAPQSSQPHFQPPVPQQPSSFSFFVPPPAAQRPPPPPYEHKPLPLLSAGTDKASSTLPSGFPLLRILPPGTSFGNAQDVERMRQRERVEETRDRLLRKFQEQVLQDKENVDKYHVGQHMLRLEASGELESARSEKSRISEKSGKDESANFQETSVATEGPELQERASSAQSLHEPQVADAATSDTRINDGFALPRGIFDSYLQLGEQLLGPEANETSAAFQMRMAQAMQRQVEKRIRAKVDFSTMTQEQVDMAMATDPAMEVVRTAEAATSITKDTGVDPIQEAINDYNLKQHNNLIPPDIFMGLRFGDQDSQTGTGPAAPSDAPGKGRSYLNVVDIRASSILRDIPERGEQAEPIVDQEKMDTAILTTGKTAEQMGLLEETMRQKFAPRSAQRPIGYDAVTVRMFEQRQGPKDDSISVAVLPRSSQSAPKTAMIRRLQDMSDQFKVIDEMAQNIERDFKSSHLLLRTLQDVNESITRSRSPSPDMSKAKKRKELRYSLEEEEEELPEPSVGRRSPGVPAPKSSARSPIASARSTKSRSSLGSRSGERLIERGSELTDLITEVLAQEGVDMQTAGYSQELADQLEKDAREQIQKERVHAGLTPRDKLLSMKKADEHLKKRTLEEREQLKEWMTVKFRERQEEYKRRRNELIEREPKPFKSQSTVSRLNLKNLEEELSEKRITMVSEFMNQRLLDAEHLMGSIIVDKPQIPLESAFVDTARSRAQSRSPRRRGSSTSPARPGRRPVSSATWSYKAGSTSKSAPPDRGRDRPSSDVSPVKGILKPSMREAGPSSTDLYLDHPVLTSISEGDRTVDSSTDLINYARQVLEMDGRSEGYSPMPSVEDVTKPVPKPRPATAPQREPSPAAPKKVPAAKGKSYADMVRLQRPEATRKWKEVNRQRQIQLENEKLSARQELSARSGATFDANLQKEKTKVYGTKQMPGSSPRQTVARRVKTYSERLQEMKPTQQFTPPPGRRVPGSVRTVSTTTFRSSVQRGPPHKPKTYVEQLQNLSSKAASTKSQAPSAGSSRGRIPLQMRTFLPSHGPKHKPKTYAEQLQELNPHPHKDVHDRKPAHSTVTLRSSASRASTRARPYSDPYSEVDYEELASVMSDWEMDENVRNIIYGGSTVGSSVSFMMDGVDVSMSGGDLHRGAPSEGQSDYYDAIMQGESLYRLGEGDEYGDGDYRTSVDIQEIERIAEIASVGSGSVLSVIDWDAVEDLIRDV